MMKVMRLTLMMSARHCRSARAEPTDQLLATPRATAAIMRHTIMPKSCFFLRGPVVWSGVKDPVAPTMPRPPVILTMPAVPTNMKYLSW